MSERDYEAIALLIYILVTLSNQQQLRLTISYELRAHNDWMVKPKLSDKNQRHKIAFINKDKEECRDSCTGTLNFSFWCKSSGSNAPLVNLLLNSPLGTDCQHKFAARTI